LRSRACGVGASAAQSANGSALFARRRSRFRRMNDDEIRAVVKRLARPHPSGGEVIERVAILAAGGDFEAIMDWITARGGRGEAVVPAAPKRGLHGSRLD